MSLQRIFSEIIVEPSEMRLTIETLLEHIEYKRELLYSIADKLEQLSDKRISASSKEIQQEIHHIAVEIRQRTRPLSRRLEIERLFTTQNRYFLDKLSAQFPTVSRAELRVAALIVRGYTTKHIAKMLGISIKAIEKHRTALRSKLCIDDSTELGSFLSQFYLQNLQSEK